MVKQLEAGVPLDHRTSYPKRNRREAASLVLAVILLLGMFAVQYILPFTGGGIRPLADQTAFPALTLEELEGQELEDRGFQVAAVSRGARAAVVKYTGNGDLADHLDEVMAMVQ